VLGGRRHGQARYQKTVLSEGRARSILGAGGTGPPSSGVPSGVESVKLDYERPETIRPALQDVDTLLLLSTTVDPERNGETIRSQSAIREGKAAAVTPAVRQLTGRDPIPSEQFARDHADKLR